MVSSSLEVSRKRPRRAKRSKWRRYLAILAAVALAVGWAVWFVRTPNDLPISSQRVDDRGVVGQDKYISMLAVGDGFERTLQVSEVQVDVGSDGEVSVEPLVCSGGSFSVTTDASMFCSDLREATDFEFTAGDSIILRVSAAEPTVVEIGRIAIAFREGVRMATKEAGIAGVTLDFAAHDPADVEVPEPDADTTTERPEQSEPGEQKDDKKDDKTNDTSGDQPGGTDENDPSDETSPGSFF
ncbi:hypothetical protein [Nocardioides stalactiti]|uniref:hypothetical protein n=1 Tax=Nocardioides stalactiti TaxID=2755356 RepID=UPI0016016538|nr:hypothetical protein [Nocardioides stalactiti]